MNKRFLLICAALAAAAVGCGETNPAPEAVCGNGIREAGEVCDTYASVTCSFFDPSQNWTSGTPGCSPTCQLTQGTCAVTATPAPGCGNNVIDSGEACDGYMFADTTASCASIMGAGATGALTCSNCQISTANCVLPSTCGNGVIDDGEVCDGMNFNGQTCGEGKTGNLSCVDCLAIDSSKCTDIEPESYCGDYEIDAEAGEECDMDNLAGKTCADLVEGSTGNLACNLSTCQYDTTNCIVEPSCGDKVKNGEEECDTADFGDKSCVDYKGEGATGSLKCSAECQIISDACLGSDESAVCGDGMVNGDEVCDGEELGDATCASETGVASAVGALKCNDDCTLDVTACIYCGDGLINGTEECDGEALNGASCEAAMGAGAQGTVSCTDECKLAYECTAAETCGNGTLDEGEACDGENIAEGVTPACKSGYKPAETLVCVSNGCLFDLDASCKLSCGDGVLDANEVCDVDAEGNLIVNMETYPEYKDGLCSSVDKKYTEGTLKCNATCDDFDYALCVEPEVDEAVCGDKKLHKDEVCDVDAEGNIIINTEVFPEYASGLCSAVDPKYVSGSVKCAATCDDFDYELCVEDKPVCGDKKLHKDEVCDVDADGKIIINTEVFPEYASGLCSAVDSKYVSGSVKCAATCDDFDYELCVEGEVEKPVCGDNKLHKDEVCDVDAEGNIIINTEVFPEYASGLCSAVDSKYVSGSVKCAATCDDFDYELCVEGEDDKPVCGDKKLHKDEVCDVDAEGNIIINTEVFPEYASGLCSAVDPKYVSGSVKCADTCDDFDYSMCSDVPAGETCNNNVLDSGESCDISLPVYTPMACLYDTADSKFESLLSDNKTYLVGTNTCSATCEIASTCTTVKSTELTTSTFYTVLTAKQGSKLVKNPSQYGIAWKLPTDPAYDSSEGISAISFGSWHAGEAGKPNLSYYVEWDLTVADKQSSFNIENMDYLNIYFNYRYVNSLSATDFGVMLYDGETPVRLIAKFKSNNVGGWNYSGNMVFSVADVEHPKLRFVSYSKGGNIYLKDVKLTGLKLK